MKYVIYKMIFPTGLHAGEHSTEDSDYVIHADTLFSALCLEAIQHGEEELERLVRYVKDGKLCFSDMLPFQGEQYIYQSRCFGPQLYRNRGIAAKKSE